MSVPLDRDSRENVKEFIVTTCHAMSNRITIHVTTLMRPLKTECDVRETSKRVMIGSLAHPFTKRLMGFKYTAIFC